MLTLVLPKLKLKLLTLRLIVDVKTFDKLFFAESPVKTLAIRKFVDAFDAC